MDTENIKKGIENGDRRFIAKAITMIEEGDSRIYEILESFKDKIGKAKVFGITGPPGVGKSTLISKLVKEARNRDENVGVLLVDPSSPISGGALLGNRVRMIEEVSDPKVYARSLATRGWFGGLSRAIDDAILVLEASGKTIIFIETVGAGQIETDIFKKADVVSLVLMPYSGDEIQALKAGLMEIADIYVINKGDLDRNKITGVTLRMIVGKEKKIVYTSALYNEGIKELYDAMINQWEEYSRNGEIERRRKIRMKSSLINDLNSFLFNLLEKFIKEYDEEMEKISEEILKGKISRYQASKELIAKLESYRH